MVSRYRAALVAFVLVVTNILFGVPADFIINKINQSKIVDSMYLSMHDKSVVDSSRSSLPSFTQKAHAANFSVQTGYYVGTGAAQTISGLGFQPQFVIIKSDTTAGAAVFKTSAMAANTTAYFGATANDTSTLITFTTDGFSVATAATVNTANVRYTWTAFAGSDCTSTGSVCIGTYTGNGANQTITTGFQPAFVMVKRSTAVAASFRTTDMTANMGQYFTTTAQNTAGALFTTLGTTNFIAGASINSVNTGSYFFVAFKSVTGIMATGTYTGSGADNRNITGFGGGATPNLVMVKNATSATTANRNPYMNNTYSNGDYSSLISSATANAANMIQALQADGFQVGSGVGVNENTYTFYWVAWGGATALPAGSGTFRMATGTYNGNGTSQTISGVGFTPDLVIIKGNTTQYGVFKTSLMSGDNTAYMSNAATNFTGGITALGSGTFNVGASATVNTSGTAYYWQAFGNAYKPNTRSGAADFFVGSYMGNGIDNRSIVGVPVQPDMVTTKRNGASAGVWRSTANTGDQTSFFAATAESNNRVQALQTTGFQVGTSAEVNTAASLYHWFGFKTGYNFTVGSYSGSGATQTITTPDFQPDMAWVKSSTTTQVGAQRATPLSGNNTMSFSNVVNYTNGITSFACSGFALTGTTATTNASGITYRYAAWRIPSSVLTVDIVDTGGCGVSSPAVSMSAATASFNCSTTTGTLGSASQRLRVTNSTTNPGWTLSIAATSGVSSLWNSGSATYDYNDNSGSPAGCADGADADSGEAGQLSFDPSSATITPRSSCSNSGVSLGSLASFQQSILDSLTLATASGAGSNCYWDITGIGVSQKIPPEKPVGTYSINLTVTVVAN